MGLKIGVCGVGSFGPAFIPVFQRHPDVDEVLLADLIPDRLAEQAVAKTRRRLFWKGTYFSFEGSNAGADQSFRIRKAYLGVRRGG